MHVGSYKMPNLSEEKKRILEDDSRVIIVKACPGSGKTKLFVEKAVQEIENLSNNGINKGIAALSFTNSATDEIHSRLSKKGITGGFPNFIGTLDSFIQKFIVQPFSTSAELVHTDGINLIPAERVNSSSGPSIRKLNSEYKRGAHPGINQYNLIKNSDEWIYRTKFLYSDVDFSEEEKFDIIDEFKCWWWGKTGNVTHNDVRSLAYDILDETSAVYNILSSRFNAILVDECQDADALLAECLSSLAKNGKFKCFFVGDPDQSIFDFGGSEGDWLVKLSEDLQISPMSLSSNYRCPQKICDVSFPLSLSAHKMTSEVSSDSKLILLEHNINKDFNNLADWQKNYMSEEHCAFLSHKNKTLQKANAGEPVDNAFSSQTLVKTHIASHAFYFGDCGNASLILRRLFRNILTNTFDEDKQREYQAMTEKDFLENVQISLNAWKSLSLSIAQESIPLSEETWDEWRIRMLDLFPEKLSELIDVSSIPWTRIMQKRAAKGKDIDSIRELVNTQQWSWQPKTEFLTIHKSKGLEFDSVIYFLPKPGAYDICPAKLWFDDNESLNEWKRVGYVAFTRAKKKLVLCMHSNSVEAIKKINIDFYNMFDEHILI